MMLKSKLHSRVSAADRRHQLQSSPSSKHPFYSGITWNHPRDVPLSPEELQFLIEKVLRMFHKLDLQEIPPVIYQLLLLSAKDVEVEKQSHFAIVSMKTAASTTLLVLSQVGRVLDEADWLISKKKSQITSDGTNTGGPSQSSAQQDPVEKALTLQLGTLLTALNELVQTALPPGACTDALLRELSRTYAILTTLIKYRNLFRTISVIPFLLQYIQLCVAHPGQLPARLEKLVKLSGSHLTPQCYSFITFVQSGEMNGGVNEKKKKKRKEEEAVVAASAKVLRDTKPIPTLIFNIEQYEKFLIVLSKKSKVNLMQYMKLSTSRDFRINAATLEAALQEQQQESQQTDTQTPEESVAPKKKRRKQ
ncbi:Fanconi anemia group I protein [Silurus asotus]|uniref:Fanconi anemia group I protein n=1 Tax=Silurus asotus TaxID=30991 RepID=A0AAD5B3X5_SILAS|nr:Fanconi anemia group I protein [Silurus asotus]